MADAPDFSSWSCPIPLRDYPTVILGHGGGGALSKDLVDHLFVPAFRNRELEALGDAAVLTVPAGRLAFSTDSFVVHPLFFPGGSIGELAVCGTVNDLAMAGAVPLCLSAAFVLEEGLPMATLGRIVEAMAAAARRAGITIVTGDTKVVERGHGHGCYITTAGIGRIQDGLDLGPHQVRPGDRVLVSGFLGDHGMAVMSVREGLEFDTTIESDTAPLGELVQALLAAAPEVRMLRDPTRGGLAASLTEIAEASKTGIEIVERDLPVRPQVQAACELLGLDPLFVANEGKLTAIVSPGQADAALAALRAHALGRDAAVVGTVVADHAGLLVAKTGLGGKRVVPLPIGEQLPRIC
ncbi:MAG: hydrogenase expression/formation protein HypE [Thermoanaerobaculia bacterium]|nr:hydrogenase expression/formation protein HypE [Thermoanaerobaculia bacterium]